MKELLWEYAEYNTWANKLIIEALSTMEATLIDKEVPSSFPTLRATVYHTWSAEYVWLERLLLAEHPKWMAGEFAGTFADACREWQRSSETLMQFIAKQYDDNALTHICEYHDRSGNTFKTPVYQILHHVFNHSTYHRGQLITMMRQLGLTKVPGTDFIAFARKK